MTEIELLRNIDKKIEMILILFISFQIITKIYPSLKSIFKGVKR